ncbi:MAG: cytochrome c family protein [Deinococcota bacterium]|jgi:hypothetical protein|nr:cytochrome c family protein [Deinococcota bacterium]
MPQVFPKVSNSVARYGILGGVVFLAALLTFIAMFNRSSFATGVGQPIEQPVHYSHALHVGELGLSCLSCHTSVQDGPFAGIPPTHTCMSCHSQILTDSPELELVRESYAENVPIAWNRVHNLADFVYFEHSAHVNKGVACVNCHGRVDQMEVVYQARNMSMTWCLNCHREPERYIRPREEVLNMAYVPPANQLELGRTLIDEYHINVNKLTNCSTCHY